MAARRSVLLILLSVQLGVARAQRAVPELTGRVVDTADMLGDPVEKAIDAQLAEHEQQTGNQVAVLTIPSLEGDDLEGYANRVFRTWRLGQADENNGVLLLIAKDDRKIRIEVGYGLEGSLTDAAAGSIIRNEITPRFRSGDFEGGTLAAISAILGTIEGTYSPPEQDSGSSSDKPPWWFFAIFLVTHGLLPAFIAFKSLVYPPGVRYFALFISLFFVGALAGILAGFVVGFFPEHPLNGLLTAGVLILCYLLVYFLLDLYMSRSPKWQKIRKQVRGASKSSKRQKIDAGWISFSAGGSSSGGGWSSSSGGFSSGGFSGGGGSSGGGGASGGW